MKRMSKGIGRICLLVLISLIIGTMLYNWNARTLTGNVMPMPFGWGMSVVISGSMEPELSVNDLVIVREQAAYKTGDVVVYQSNQVLVIHRIISMDGDIVITQGDANDVADAPISVSAIKGREVAHIPFVGAVIRFLKTPVGSVLLLLAAIVLFELPYLQKRKKAEKDMEKIKEEIRKLKGE